VLFHPGAPKPFVLLSYQRTILTVKASMFDLQWIILFETCLGKNAEAAKRAHFLTQEPFSRLRFNPLMQHTKDNQHNQFQNLLCACSQSPHS
jgi:hypothetical protein